MVFLGYVSGILSPIDVRTAVSTKLRAVNNETGNVLLWTHCKSVSLSWAQCGDKSLNPTLGKQGGW
jgi:hypothetical protein